MKRVLQFIAAAFVFFIISAAFSYGQDKKSEQKIKIVVSEGSGTKVVLDTLIKDGNINDSIRLKDGKVVFIGHPGDESRMQNANSTEHIYVTVKSDGNETNRETKTITILSSDPVTMSDKKDGNNVIVMNSSKSTGGKGGSHYKIVTRDSGEKNREGDNYIYLNDDQDSTISNGKSIDVTVISDDRGSVAEKSRYIIARDGMVVTIEGNDEAKTKELAAEIEKKLGVKNDGADKKEVIKVESKKNVKK